MTTTADPSPRIWGRAVGVLYLLMIVAGALPFLAGSVGVTNDAATTAAAILAHPSRVYAAFAGSLLVVVFYLPVPVLFYKLLKPVNDTLSLIAAFFGLVGCAVQAFACLFRIAPLTILTTGQSSPAMNQEQVQALAYLILKLYTPTYSISLVFFAFAFAVIGYLVFRSTFLPRFLGVLAMIAGFGWMPFLWPPLAELLWPRVILPLDLGELALVLWLLFAGVKLERWHEQANAAKL